MQLIGIFTFLNLISGIIAIMLGVYVFRYRQSAYQISLSFLFFSVAWWDIATIFESISKTLQEHILWVAISYPGMMATPVLFFLFIYQYTHINNSIRRIFIYFLFFIPVVSCIFVGHPRWRYFVWEDVVLNETPYGGIAHCSHGWWYYIEAYFSYALIILGIFYLIKALYQFPKRYSWQVRLLLFSSLVPLFSNIVYTFKSNYLYGLDVTPVALTMTTIFFYFAISKHKLLQLRPVAWNIVIENIHEGVIVLDSTNTIIDSNNAANKMLENVGVFTAAGISIQVCLQESFQFTDFLSDESKEKAEVNLRDKYFEITRKIIVNRLGKKSGQILVFHDITDSKRKEEEIIAINLQLKNANEMKDFLFKVVSHDLKGPIGNISSLLELWLENNEHTQQEKKELQAINKASVNVYYLLDNILHWANSQQNELVLKPVSHRVYKTISRACEVIHYQATEKNIQINISCSETLTAFYDAVTIEIVIRNLLSNAIKFSYKDGSINVTAGEEDKSVCIKIKDDGIGMSANTIQSTKNNIVVKSHIGTMKEKGTGIGLHMCQNLIHANHGSLAIDSQLNIGTTVTVCLPVETT
jgi:signal transduction histidine kinase